MAHIKAGGTTRANKDSVSKRLGVKVFGGQMAQPGSVIVRQKGTRVYPGEGVSIGRDFTIFSLASGIVEFFTKKGKQYVSVLPKESNLPMKS